jgi:hypothetical protein
MDHGRQQVPARHEAGEGCPATSIRIPAGIVVPAVVLPVRDPVGAALGA